MAWRFYAVRKGKRTGVVTSWEECKEMTLGYAGAEYKGFNLEEEANEYLKTGKVPMGSAGVTVDKPDSPDAVNVYARGTYVGGVLDIGVVIEGQSKVCELFGDILCKDYPVNVFVGELVATMVAAQLCRDMSFTNINIVFSYDGVEKWFNGDWAARGSIQNEYLKCLTWLSRNCFMKFTFTKGKKNSRIRFLNDAEKLITRASNNKSYIDKDKTFRCQLTTRDVPLYSIS